MSAMERQYDWKISILSQGNAGKEEQLRLLKSHYKKEVEHLNHQLTNLLHKRELDCQIAFEKQEHLASLFDYLAKLYKVKIEKLKKRVAQLNSKHRTSNTELANAVQDNSSSAASAGVSGNYWKGSCDS